MKYCCTAFEDRAKASPGFEKQEDGTWSVIDFKEYVILTGFKFCPFCGHNLSPRYVLEEAEAGGWFVMDVHIGRIQAYFDTEEQAQDYVKDLG